MAPNANTTASNVGILHSGNKIHKPGKSLTILLARLKSARSHITSVHSLVTELVKKIGGNEVLRQAVNNFYDRLTVDPQISVFFHGADVQLLRWHQFNRKSSVAARALQQ